MFGSCFLVESTVNSIVYRDTLEEFFIPIRFWMKRLLITYLSATRKGAEPFRSFTLQFGTSCIGSFRENGLTEAALSLGHLLTPIYTTRLLLLTDTYCIHNNTAHYFAVNFSKVKRCLIHSHALHFYKYVNQAWVELLMMPYLISVNS